MSPADLIREATLARSRAFAPYSRFQVGAALQTPEGQVIHGCNVESASYGLTICAERVALVKAVSEGITRFSKIAIVTDVAELTPPCGACRQLLWEFAPELEVILANLHVNQISYRIAALRPHAFDARQLH